MNFKIELTEKAMEFIISQPIKMQAKIQRAMDLLAEFGYMLPDPHSKKIKGRKDLYELRIQLGSDICRLFYFYWKENKYIITSGYIKKRKKADKNEIKKAENIIKKFKEE